VPSPVAHSLAGVALVWLFRYPLNLSPEPSGGRPRGWLVTLAAVILASVAADFDFLPGFLVGMPGRFHRGPTHSFGAAVIYGVLALAYARWRGIKSPNTLGLLLGLVYGSHVVLDVFTLDFGDQIGVPLWWPLLSGNVVAPFHLFLYIQRGPGSASFFASQFNAHNGYAVLWEVAVMSTVLLIVRLVGAAPSRLWTRVRNRLDPP